MLAIRKHARSVDKHLAHAGRKLVRPLERGVVLNAHRVEHHHVGVVPVLEAPASLEPEVLSGKRAQPPNGFCKRHDMFVAHVLCEQPREAAVRPWVGAIVQKNALGSQ